MSSTLTVQAMQQMERNGTAMPIWLLITLSVFLIVFTIWAVRAK